MHASRATCGSTTNVSYQVLLLLPAVASLAKQFLDNVDSLPCRTTQDGPTNEILNEILNAEVPVLVKMDAAITEINQTVELVVPNDTAAHAASEPTRKKIVGLVGVCQTLILERGLKMCRKKLDDLSTHAVKVASELDQKIAAAFKKEPVDNRALCDLVRDSAEANTMFERWMDWRKSLEIYKKIEQKLPTETDGLDKIKDLQRTMNQKVKSTVAKASCLAAALRPMEQGETRKKVIAAAKKTLKSKDQDEPDLILDDCVSKLVQGVEAAL